MKWKKSSSQYHKSSYGGKNPHKFTPLDGVEGITYGRAAADSLKNKVAELQRLS